MKRFFSALVFAFFSLSVFAFDFEDFSLSVEPLFGMKWGQVDEYVFLNTCEYNDDKLSELNWEIKPELYYGLKIRGGWKGFFEETSFSAGIPMKTGEMYDSDWMNVQLSGADDYQYKTNFSESDNNLDYDFVFGLKGGYEFHLRKIFTIRPAVAFDYQNVKFTANGGTAWYGKSVGAYKAPYSDSKNQEIWDFSGQDVIGYKRIAYYFWLGSDFSVSLPFNFSASTGFFFSPYLYAESFDSHFLTSTDYADRTPGFFAAFKWNLGLEYKLNERHSFALNANYFFMRALRGEDFEKAHSEKTYRKSNYADGGAGAKYLDISISYRFKIF